MLSTLFIFLLLSGQPSPAIAAPVDETLAAIQQQRPRLSATDAPSAEREIIIEDVLRMRGELIDSNPRHLQRPVWLADQAADFIFELLPLDGSGLAALFGLPTPQQSARAQRAAAQSFEFAQRAERDLQRAIDELEAMPNFRNDPASQQQRRLLIEREREQRVPLLRGISAVLHAQLNLQASESKQEAAALYSMGIRLLTSLPDTIDAAAARQARLYAGLAYAHGGAGGRPDACESILSALAADLSAAPAETFAARMGLVVNRTTQAGPAAGLEALAALEQQYAGAHDVFFRIIVVDHRFLLRRRLAEQAPPDQKAQLLARAFAAYTDLLHESSRIPLPRESLRAIVFARLALASDIDAPLHQLPALVRIARADRLSRSPLTRHEAILTLENALEEPPSDAALESLERACALFALGRALLEHNQPLLAAQRFYELAHHHPADFNAERAIELCVTILNDHLRQSPDDRDASALFHAGLDLLLTRYPNVRTIERWRFAAAQMALEEQRFDEASRLFQRVARDSPLWLDAQYMTVLVAREQMLRLGGNAAAQKALAIAGQVTPLLERGIEAAPDESRADVLRHHLAMLHVVQAEALIGLDQPQQAIDVLDEGFDQLPPSASEVLGLALKVRLDAYKRLGRPERALEEAERWLELPSAQVAGAFMPLFDAIQREVEALLDQNRTERAAELARKALLPLAAIAQRHIDSEPTASDKAPMVLRIAEAHRLSGSFDEALPWYERVLIMDSSALPPLIGKAECLFHLGGGGGGEVRLAQAMEIYKRVAAARSPAAIADSHSHEYWLAQLRMLQTLKITGRNTHQIAPRIERLRQQNSTLGGERFRDQFNALLRK